MKLRLVSRLMVVALVLVVGIIIIIHQRASTPGGTSHPAQPQPTVFVGSVAYRHGFRYDAAVPAAWSSEVPKCLQFVEVEGS